MRAPEVPEQVNALLVTLDLDRERDAHRAATDSTTVIQKTYHGPLPIDLIVLDDASEMDRLIRGEFAPFYSRATYIKTMDRR